MKRHLWKLLCLSALCLLTASMCSEEDDFVVDTPTLPDESVGTVEYKVDTLGCLTGNAVGEGTALSPAMPGEGEDTLRLAFSQQVTYTDPDGSTFSCEPQATVQMYATLDTVMAKNVSALTNLNLQPQTEKSETGTRPKQHTTRQTYTLGGGQEVCFDFMYQVFSHVNSRMSTVQLPYVKVDGAIPGGQLTAEEQAAAVTLRSVSATRASVTDSTLYLVEALFTIEATCVNPFVEGSAPKYSVVVAVNYLGIVEEVTELVGHLDYTYSYNDTAPTEKPSAPYLLEIGQTSTLTLKQQGCLLKQSDTLYTVFPEASIAIGIAETGEEMGSEAALTTLTEGEYTTDSVAGNPAHTTAHQTLNIGGLSIDIATRHEKYTTEKEGYELPYLQVGKATKCEAKATLVSRTKNTRATHGVILDTLIYDLDLTLTLPVQTMNCNNPYTEMLSFTLSRQVTLIEQIKVTYRKDQVFYEGHDNLLPASQCEVYRDRHYSDGHVETDEFYDVPWMWVESVVALAMNGSAGFPSDTIIKFSDDLTVVYGEYQKYWDKEMGTATDRTYRYARASTQIPDFDHVVVEPYILIKHHEEYNESYGAQLKDYNYNPDDPVEGWYMFKDVNLREKRLKYSKNGESICFRYYSLIMNYYDRFLCIDDTIIGFKEFRPKLEETEGFIDYAGSETRGPGKIYQHIIKGDYLGHPVYMEITDTIYTPKDNNIGKDDRNISVTLDAPTDVAYASATLHARVVGHEGEVFPQYGFYVQLPHTGEWRFFEADNVSADGSYFSATVSVVLEIGETHRYYAQIGGPLTLSHNLITSDTQTFTTKHTNISTDKAVDLGLSVKWASHNLGATNMQGKGTTFHQWPATDVVESQWGEGWRLPTAKEAEELIDHCHQEWINYQGRQGFLLAADNGNAIFLPAVGCSSGGNIDRECSHLTSSEYTFWDFTIIQGFKGKKLGLNYKHKEVNLYLYPIRPVRE